MASKREPSRKSGYNMIDKDSACTVRNNVLMRISVALAETGFRTIVASCEIATSIFNTLVGSASKLPKIKKCLLN